MTELMSRFEDLAADESVPEFIMDRGVDLRRTGLASICQEHWTSS